MKGKKKKWLIAGGVAAALCLALVIVSQLRGGEALPAVATMKLAKGDIEKSITLKAPLEGMDKAEVVSSLHCEVMELKVEEGDSVAKGQLLAVLDDQDLLLAVEKARDQLELTRFQYQEGLKESQRQYAKIKEGLTAARKQYERSQSLYEAGSLSLQELETAESSLKDLENQAAAYAVSKESVVLSQSQNKQLSILEKALGEAEDKLAQAQVKSPIDGIVTRVNVRLGRFADETENKSPMFVIEDLSKLQMKVQISEYDIGQVAVGQKATISADILGGKAVAGQVSRISPTGESKSGGTERVIPTIIDIKEENNQLIAGINAKAVIHLAKSENTFTVPLEALVAADGSAGGAVDGAADGSADGAVDSAAEGSADGAAVSTGAGSSASGEAWQVYRVTAAGILELVDVTLGIENDLQAEILSDRLAEGDTIITIVTPDLHEGMQVQAPAAEAAAEASHE